MDIFVARQPIFNIHKKVIGYELLFRDGLSNAFPDIDHDVATSNVLSNVFFSHHLPELLNGKKGFINFTEKLLIQKIPLLFSQSALVIEVLENIEPRNEILNSLNELRKKGLSIALDDFILKQNSRPLIECADIIKIDLLATPLSGLKPTVQELKSQRRLELLAEKVETQEAFMTAKQMGFTLFQGYFFAKPEIIKNREIPPNKLSKIKLLNEISSPSINFERLETIVKKDVSIAFKLLKYINSAYFKRPNAIETLKDAMTLLGIRELKKFIYVLVVSDLGDQKPNELVRKSILRGRMCEKYGDFLKTSFSQDELYLLGLFSLLDAILDKPMDEVLEIMSFSEKLKSAMLGRDKEFNKLMDFVLCFEKGDWKSKKLFLIQGTQMEKKMLDIYLDSLLMADHIC